MGPLEFLRTGDQNSSARFFLKLQPHPWPVAIAIKKHDPGSLEGGPHAGDGTRLKFFPAFEPCYRIR